MKNTRLFALCLAILTLVGSAQAATITVSSTNDDLVGGDGLCTLREAVRNANTPAGGDLSSGDCVAGDAGFDEISVPAGTFTLTLAGINEDFASTGDLDLRDSVRIVGAGGNATVIQGSGDRIFDVRHNLGSTVSIELQFLALEQGNPLGTLLPNGGAIIIRDPHELEFSNGRITDNTAANGAGVYSDGADITFDTVRFELNDAVTAGGGISAPEGTITLVDCEFIANSAPFVAGGIHVTGLSVLEAESTLFSGNSAPLGGAISAGALGLQTIDSCRFESNSATDDGGAIFTTSPLDINGSVFELNSADDLGGAIAALDHVTLHNVEMLNNDAREGGAVHMASGDLTVTDSTFRDNEATDAGGAITGHGEVHISGSELTANVAGTNGGALMITDLSSVTTTLIENNLAEYGGGIYTDWDNFGLDLTLTHSALVANEATQDGGGMYVDGASLADMLNVTISGNEAGVEGGAVFCSGDCDFDFSTIMGNTAPGTGGVYNQFNDVSFKNSILASNFPAGCGGHTIDSHGYNIVASVTCNFTDPTDIVGGFLWLEPLAYNGGPTPTHGLQPLSPAIDSADPSCNRIGGSAATEDQRFVARPQDGDGDSSALCDRGAFEVQAVTVPPPVPNGVFGTPMTVERANAAGTELDLTWDVSTCTADDYHLVYGNLADVGLYLPLGGACDLGNSGSATNVNVAAGSIWFLIVADDDDVTEGSWGESSSGIRNPGMPSGGCGLTTRDDAGTCN